MIFQASIRKFFPDTKSQREVPSVFRETGILNGFRKPNEPWLYYFASLLQPHNELLNMWTHLVGMVLVIMRGISMQNAEGVSLVKDPFYWPLLSGLVAIFMMYFLSTVAHTFQSRSEIAHYVFFMCDYAGIGVYGMASGVLHLIYCSCEDFYNACGSFFIPVCIMTGVFACAGNCLSKVMFQKPYPKVRVFWQAIPILTMYIWINLPILYRLARYGLHGDSIYSTGLVYHCRQIICFLIGGFLYATNLPQVVFPGKFDILGHSHQLFHLFIIFTNLNQLSGISADLKHIRPSFDDNRNTFSLFASFAPLLVTVFFQALVIASFIVILHNRIRRRESGKESGRESRELTIVRPETHLKQS